MKEIVWMIAIAVMVIVFAVCSANNVFGKENEKTNNNEKQDITFFRSSTYNGRKELISVFADTAKAEITALFR